MDRCANCQYYDRNKARGAESSQAGQCRRSAPMLSPLNAKSYMIEGVWPTVRDDDWCGEWKSSLRRAETRIGEASSAMSAALAGTPRVSPMSSVPAAAVASVARGSD